MTEVVNFVCGHASFLHILAWSQSPELRYTKFLLSKFPIIRCIIIIIATICMYFLVRAELLLMTQMHFGCLLELYNVGRLQPPLPDDDQRKTEVKRPRSRPSSARVAYQPMMETFRTQH